MENPTYLNMEVKTIVVALEVIGGVVNNQSSQSVVNKLK